MQPCSNGKRHFAAILSNEQKYWVNLVKKKSKNGQIYVDISLIPRPSSLVGKNKGEEGLVKLIT